MNTKDKALDAADWLKQEGYPEFMNMTRDNLENILNRYAAQLNKQIGAVWVKASERLPEIKGFYITKRPTLNKDSVFIVKEEVFNPKYEDIKEKWVSFEYQWLDESQSTPTISLPDDEIEKMAEKKYPMPESLDIYNWDEDVIVKRERAAYIKGLKHSI